MSVSVWFIIVPWLIFGAGLVGLILWLRRSPRSPKPRRRGPRSIPDQRRQGGENDAELGRYEATSS